MGAHGLVSQPAVSAVNLARMGAPNDLPANESLHFGLNGTQAQCYSTQCHVVPFSNYYGVARVVLDFSTLPSLSFMLEVNSSLGPAYIEQIQLAFYNENYTNPPAVTSYWKFNSGLGYGGVSDSGATCSAQPGIYISLVASCDPTFKLNDPLDNSAILIGPGSSTAPSASILVSVSGGTGDASGQGVSNYPATITALVVAPIGALVTLSS